MLIFSHRILILVMLFQHFFCKLRNLIWLLRLFSLNLTCWLLRVYVLLLRFNSTYWVLDLVYGLTKRIDLRLIFHSRACQNRSLNLFLVSNVWGISFKNLTLSSHFQAIIKHVRDHMKRRSIASRPVWPNNIRGRVSVSIWMMLSLFDDHVASRLLLFVKLQLLMFFLHS